MLIYESEYEKAVDEIDKIEQHFKISINIYTEVLGASGAVTVVQSWDVALTVKRLKCLSLRRA